MLFRSIQETADAESERRSHGNEVGRLDERAQPGTTMRSGPLRGARARPAVKMRTGNAPRSYTTAPSLKIGRYMAITMPPMRVPSTTMIIGSIRLDSASTASSTSCSK